MQSEVMTNILTKLCNTRTSGAFYSERVSAPKHCDLLNFFVFKWYRGLLKYLIEDTCVKVTLKLLSSSNHLILINVGFIVGLYRVICSYDLMWSTLGCLKPMVKYLLELLHYSKILPDINSHKCALLQRMISGQDNIHD